MLQVLMKRGMNKWGKRAEDAMSNDLKMLQHERGIITSQPILDYRGGKDSCSGTLNVLEGKGGLLH